MLSWPVASHPYSKALRSVNKWTIYNKKYVERGRSLKPALIPAIHITRHERKRGNPMVPVVKCGKQVDHGKATSACFIFTTRRKKSLPSSVARERERKKKTKTRCNKWAALFDNSCLPFCTFRSNLRSGLLWRRAAKSFNILCTNNLLKCTYNVLSPWTATAKVERKEVAGVLCYDVMMERGRNQ